MDIDPLETIIKWLGTALTSAAGRVAGKHRYGDAWSEIQTGVSVHLDGGAPDLYAPIQDARIEVRIYANEQPKIAPVYRELVSLCRTNERFAVAVSGGKTALVHRFNPASGLSIIYEDTLNMDMGVVFFDAMIGEAKIS